MVGLINGLFDVVTVGAEKRTPAQAKKHFEQPRDFPDWTPPEYRSISGLKRIGLDIEGHDPDLMELGPGAHRKDGKVVGVAIAYGERDASYYPTAHEVGPNVEDPDKFYARLAHEAKDFEGEIVGANLQYDLDWLRARHGIIFPKAKFRDVQIAEPLLDENRLTYKLDALAKDYLGVTKTYDELLRRYGGGYIEQMHRVHSGDVSPYACDDTTLAWRILDKQTPKLEADSLTELFHLESALTPLLLEMRYRGVRVDIDKAESSHRALKQEQADIEKRINEMAQAHVDIWSAESIAVAFDNLGVEYEKTSTGKASFRKEWLNSCNAEVAKLIVQARENDKIAGTFIDSYILKGHVDGRLHCMFNQLKSDDSGTVSGRFSSSNPNLQNIPARHPVLGPLMRSMFIPEEGMLWGSLDWSQIEYRLLVHYAAITKGIDASEAVRMYRSDPKTDFHTMASQITGVPRKQAKNINFGVVYGMGVPKLAGDLGVSLDEARAIMAQFQENAPFMKGMLDRCSNAAANRGFIRTILGRKRRFDVWEVKVRGKAEPDFIQEAELEAFIAGKNLASRPRRAFTHKALNALLQGSAADLMKKAMVQMWDSGIFNVLVPHLTVHDEFNSSVPDTKEGREAFDEMRHIMETALTLEIPILADGTLGSSWDEAKG
ncbi:DNA polymerase I [Pseudanabaena phage Pan1]|nr:DNA polymerase I [Pseudanabaena phage Pan1]